MGGGVWTETSSMRQARFGHTATLLPDGRVLVVGGCSGDGALATAEIYDPKAGFWTVASDMVAARIGHTATLLPGTDGLVLVTGGSGGQVEDVPLRSAELYRPDEERGEWMPVSMMSIGRKDHTATLLGGGDVLVVGDDSAEIYRAGRAAWESVASPTTKTSPPPSRVAV